MTPQAPALQRLGDFFQRRQDLVRRVQWGFVAMYLLLLAAPALMPRPLALAGLAVDGARLAEAVFWGIWWPSAILATLLFGQFWCGLLCPDGTMTEFLSRHGREAKIPLKLRWSGWPLLAFIFVTLAWHLFDARHSPTGTLALLGGSSLAAWATGYWLARGKRVWCRYLCPAASVFSLLARGALLHFRVDRGRWDATPRPLPRPVDCPQLLDVRRLNGNDKCSMCCRCSGHRDAVKLALRLPGAEIAALREDEAEPLDAFVICFVLIGLCFSVARQHIGLVAILLNTATVGGGVAALLWLGALGNARRAALMTYGLIPLAGTGMFLSALEYAQGILSRSGIGSLAGMPMARGLVLVAAGIWAIAIGLAMVRKLNTTSGGRVAAALAQVVAVSAIVLIYLPGSAAS